VMAAPLFFSDRAVLTAALARRPPGISEKIIGGDSCV
jgi:hypothetical protein